MTHAKERFVEFLQDFNSNRLYTKNTLPYYHIDKTKSFQN